MDWNEYQKQIGARIGELGHLSPDTLRGYQTLSNVNSKESKLGEKVRQLISLAVVMDDGEAFISSSRVLDAVEAKSVVKG